MYGNAYTMYQMRDKCFTRDHSENNAVRPADGARILIYQNAVTLYQTFDTSSGADR